MSILQNGLQTTSGLLSGVLVISFPNRQTQMQLQTTLSKSRGKKEKPCFTTLEFVEKQNTFLIKLAGSAQFYEDVLFAINSQHANHGREWFDFAAFDTSINCYDG